MKDEYLLLFMGLIVLAVVVLAPREPAPVIVNNPAAQGGGGGPLDGLFKVGASLLGAFGF